MDTRLLRHFLAVVEHKGVTRAAAANYIAQPALSQNIRLLEAELDVQLFSRQHRGMELTPAGEAFVPSAREILALSASADEAAAAVTALRGGWLNIIAPADLSLDPLAGLIEMFRAEFPDVWVNVVAAPHGSSVIDALRSTTTEVGIGYMPETAEADADVVRLSTQEIHAGFPPSWVGPLPDAIAAGDLWALPLILPDHQNRIREAFDVAVDSEGVRLQVVAEVPQLHTAGMLLAAGVGVAIVDKALADRLQIRGVESRPFSPPIELEVGLVHRHGPLSPAAKAFVDLVLGQTSVARGTDSL